MTPVEKQMACQLLTRRDWTWPEVFAFLELVTQKPLEPDERRALQGSEDLVRIESSDPALQPKKFFHADQPIRLDAISDQVFKETAAAHFEPDYFASTEEYKKTQKDFRKHFEQYMENLARLPSFRILLEVEHQTKLKLLLYRECRKVLKNWWEQAGHRLQGFQP